MKKLALYTFLSMFCFANQPPSPTSLQAHQPPRQTKGHLFLFNHFIDMRTTVSLSISCRKNVFLLKFSNKNTFFPHKMDKLTVVLMSIKRLNKERRPLAFRPNYFRYVHSDQCCYRHAIESRFFSNSWNFFCSVCIFWESVE